MRGKARRWRVVALLALGITIGVAMTATPAASHVGGTVAHVANHMKTYFFTKSQSDSRYQRQAHVGYAYINADGTLDTARTKNVAEIQKQAAGVYCLRPTFVPKSVIASGVRDAGNPDGIVETKASPNGSSCQAIYGEAFNVQVVVVRVSTGAFADHAVMVQLMR